MGNTYKNTRFVAGGVLSFSNGSAQSHPLAPGGAGRGGRAGKDVGADHVERLRQQGDDVHFRFIDQMHSANVSSYCNFSDHCILKKSLLDTISTTPFACLRGPIPNATFKVPAVLWGLRRGGGRKRDGFSAPAEVFAVSRTRLPYGWTGRVTTITTVRKVMSSTWVATGWSEALRSMCSTIFIIDSP